ncbi:MAG: hypothetical protein WKF96_18935 [Solirubrobacteraceae bacterium]
MSATVVPIVAVVAWLISAPAAFAQDPACSGAPAAKLIRVMPAAGDQGQPIPTRLPVGRSLRFDIADDFSAESEVLDTHLVVRNAAGDMLSTSTGAGAITTPPGATTFTATWREYPILSNGMGTCIRVVTATLTGFTGAVPKVIVFPFRSGDIHLFLASDNADASCVDTVALQAVEVSIRSGARRISLRRSDPCGGWSGGGRLPGFSVPIEPDREVAYFSSRWNRSGFHRLELSVSVDGRLTKRRAITVEARVRRTPARRIVQGTDAFVNYCINRNRTVRSVNGELYCTRPGTTRRTYRLDVAGVRERP